MSALGTSFYRRRSDEGFVYLNRRASDITHPIGQFCCAVPDAVGVIQTLCIIISMLANTVEATDSNSV